MEGILHRALALVVSLYCNLFPPPDVPLSKHANVQPEIPIQTYQVVSTCFRGPRLTEATGDSDTSVGGWRADKEGKKERSRETDRPTRQTQGGVGHMLTPADDTGMTWRSKGSLRAETG